MTPEWFLARRLINLLRDVVLAMLYFRVPMEKGRSALRRTLGALSLISFFMLYSAEEGSFFYSAGVQHLVRFLAGFACVSLGRTEPLSVNLFHALFFSATCTLSHNLFLTPVTRPVLLMTYTFVQTPWLNALICLAIVNVVVLAVYVPVFLAAPYNKNRVVHPFQVMLLLAISMIAIYSNQTLRILTDTARSYTQELSVYSIVQQVGLLLCMILMERERRQAQEGMQAHLQALYAKNALRMIEQQRQRDDRLHALWHDMRNHILSLRYLIKAGDHDASVQYMDRLLSEGEREEEEYETGITLLNGLLSAKLSQAAAEGVRTDIFCDLRQLAGVADVDLCIIFGNAIDNALEALRALNPQDDRYVHMRAAQAGGYLTVTLTNPCRPTEWTQREGLPRTTKADRQYHGIGLGNIRRVMEKYGGVLEIHYEPARSEFKLILMFPMNAAEGV